MAKRKPWRKFKYKRPKNKILRRVCLAVLGAELGVLWVQDRLTFPVIMVTESQEVVIYQIPLGEEDAELPSKDRIYGIRIRLKDGVVDLYRREELSE